jgi:predicted kinase
MKFRLEDLGDIAARFRDQSAEEKKDLVLIAGLPGSGKTTLAREFARQTRGTPFDIDEVKRVVVPADAVKQGIDPPEVRYQYYLEAIRRLPELFEQSPTNVVIIDETFHLKDFREMWENAAEALGIRVHWVEACCDEAVLKERLSAGKGRENHVLGDRAFPMYLMFKEAFEQMEEIREVVETHRDIVSQTDEIVKKRALKRPRPGTEA